jgi:hypothetical protein
MGDVDRVYSVHSTLEVPVDELWDYLDDPDLPDPVDRLETTRRSNTLFIESVSDADSIGEYAPTATLRASMTDVRIFEYRGERSRTAPPTVVDESPDSELVTFAQFKGRLDTVLQNTALQGPMFEVLNAIAYRAEQGHLKAIVERDGDLDAVYVDDGEDVPSSVEVVPETGRSGSDEAARWQYAQS